MHDFISASNRRRSAHSARRFLSRALLALVAGLASSSLAVAEMGTQAGTQARYDASGGGAAEVPWKSGGIGEAAIAEMRQAAADYNVLIVFSDRQGSYLADIPFTVTRRDGREILSGVSEGPLLHIRLPAATYRISAKLDGTWQSRQVSVGSTAQPRRLSFIGRAD
jgi:hypothetical protein